MFQSLFVIVATGLRMVQWYTVQSLMQSPNSLETESVPVSYITVANQTAPENGERERSCERASVLDRIDNKLCNKKMQIRFYNFGCKCTTLEPAAEKLCTSPQQNIILWRPDIRRRRSLHLIREKKRVVPRTGSRRSDFETS